MRIADWKNCGMDEVDYADGVDTRETGLQGRADAPAGRPCLEVDRERRLKSDEQIDLGLAVLICLRRRGERMSYEAIAAATGLNEIAVQRIERRALDKLLEVPGLREAWLEECEEETEEKET